jgi:serpin B
MTANGAEKETLAEMESVLGMNTKELNSYLYSYVKELPQGEKYKLCLANSIWFNEDTRFTVNQNFLQTNADYYGADVYKAPFNKKTCRDINNWVKEKTDELIPDILDSIPAEAVMYLVNALAFEAEWSEAYNEDSVSEGRFTMENGTVKTVEFMYGTESRYFEDERATGFMKYYSGGKYAFVALLPNQGISIEEYVSSLSGKALNNLLSTPTITTVNTAIPKFETEYKTDMAGVLKKMGMPSAFDPKQADLSGLGTSSAGNLFISRVLHKTFISVAEKGTKAGAATIVEIMNESCVYPDIPTKQVLLNRPFVYMLIDCENSVPFFIGTAMELGK